MRRDRAPGPGRVAAGLALALLALGAAAAPPDWLARLSAVLPEPQRARLQQRWDIWRGWSPAEREAYARRAAAWDALPAAERAQRRERYAAWQALPAAERAQVRDAAARHAAMPPQLQQAWRARFEALDGSERRGWLLGPALGADYAALQPLLAQVPEPQHWPLLQALRALTPAQRAQLAVLAQRTPPHQRDALRRELLATPADRRGAWLAGRLQR